MRRIETSIDIGAPAERVWSILTDFDAFPRWNPFISEISGTPEAGEHLSVHIQPPGGRAMTFHPEVLEANAPHLLRWLGRLGIKGIFDGEHRWQIESLAGDRSRFLHSETFSGLLVPILGSMLSKTEAGFREMNEALKQRAESENEN